MRLKKIIALFLAAFFGLSFASSSFHVKTVFDGDTVQLENGDKVRYLGIDTPEMGEAPEFMAEEARLMNRRLVAGKKVRLEFDREREDRHGRKLAYVFLENGEMVNLLLLRKGLAHVLVTGPGLNRFSVLLENQRMAMKESIGIWGREVRDPNAAVLGNTRSFIFHKPDCDRGKEISRRNRKVFQNRRSAFWEGFHPCRICTP
jgi:micrococcal nuclease